MLAAEVLGYEAGTVQEGKLADLLLVRGNPLRDLFAVDAIVGVMIDGAWHPAADLAARMDSVESACTPGNEFVTAALGHNVARAVSRHRLLKSSGDPHRTAPGVISYVAYVVRSRGGDDDAIKLYELALEENPALASAHEGIARAHLAAGRVKEAVAALRQALAIEPERASAKELLASLRPRGAPQRGAMTIRGRREASAPIPSPPPPPSPSPPPSPPVYPGR